MNFLSIIFSEWLIRENTCLKISAVGLFCCDKFEETTNKKVSDLSKPDFRYSYFKFEIVNFILGLHGPEGNHPKDGQYDYELILSSAKLHGVASNDMNDDNLCSV